MARAEHAAFDASRLADFTERIHFNSPAVALSPLVREAGRLVRHLVAFDYFLEDNRPKELQAHPLQLARRRTEPARTRGRPPGQTSCRIPLFSGRRPAKRTASASISACLPLR